MDVCTLTGNSRSEVVLVGRNWWVKSWSGAVPRNPQIVSAATGLLTQQLFVSKHSVYAHRFGALEEKNTTLPIAAIRANERNTFYIAGYFGISFLICLLGIMKFIWVYIGSIRASRVLFTNMTAAVLNAPLSWLDSMPTGRILNRFVGDFCVIDSRLANNLVLLLYNGLQLVGIIFAGVLVSPYLLFCAVPLLAVCIAYARIYLAGARDVKRLGK